MSSSIIQLIFVQNKLNNTAYANRVRVKLRKRCLVWNGVEGRKYT